MQIRDAQLHDLEAILAIHNHVLLNTTAIFEEAPETMPQRIAWFNERKAAGFPVLCAVENETLLGFASYGTWRARCGYKATVEHSVHVDPAIRGKGVGTALILALLDCARREQRHVMLSGIAGENTGSLRLHERLGFRETGRMSEVGFKFGRWLDLVFMQINL